VLKAAAILLAQPPIVNQYLAALGWDKTLSRPAQQNITLGDQEQRRLVPYVLEACEL